MVSPRLLVTSFFTAIVALIILLGSKIFKKAALPFHIIITIILTVLGAAWILLRLDQTWATDSAQAILFGIVWTLSYIYIRKGVITAQNPNIMYDGLYGGIALAIAHFVQQTMDRLIQKFRSKNETKFLLDLL